MDKDKQNLKESIADMIGSWARKYAPKVSSGGQTSQPSETDQPAQQTQTKQNVPSNQSAATSASKQATGTSAQKGGGRVQPKAGVIDARRATYGKLMLALKTAGVTEEPKQKQYAEELLTNIIIPYLAANLNARGINITDARSKQPSVSKNPIKDASGNPKVITIAEAKASDRKINNPQVVRKTAESERTRASRRQRDEERKAKKRNQGSTAPSSTPTSDQPKTRRKAPGIPEKYIKLAQEEEQASSGASSGQTSGQAQTTGETGNGQRRKTVPVNRTQNNNEFTKARQSLENKKDEINNASSVDDLKRIINSLGDGEISNTLKTQFIQVINQALNDPNWLSNGQNSNLITSGGGLRKKLYDLTSSEDAKKLNKLRSAFETKKDVIQQAKDLNDIQRNVINPLISNNLIDVDTYDLYTSIIKNPQTFNRLNMRITSAGGLRDKIANLISTNAASPTAGTSTTPTSPSAPTPSGTAPQRKKRSEMTPYEKMLGLNIDPNKPIELFKGDGSLLQRMNVFLRQKGVQISAQGFQDQMLQIIKDIVAQLKVNGITNQQIQEHFDLTQELINESLVVRWKVLANIK